MSLKRKCGFLAIPTCSLRKSVLDRGRNLWKSGHVLSLEEERVGLGLGDSENTDPNVFSQNSNQELEVLFQLFGSVLPQTSVSNPPYAVVIKLSKDRTIIDSTCGCKAGLSQCKHKAAVIVAVNEEQTETKTSLPQSWGKPSIISQGKYKKGYSISQLFPKVQACPAVGKDPPLHFLKDLGDNDTALSLMLNTENTEETLRIASDVLYDLVTSVDSSTEKEYIVELCSVIHEKQKSQNLYRNYELIQHPNGSYELVSKKYSLTEDLVDFYNESVCTSATKASDICLKTVKQSDCKEWFNERKLRISSTIAHRVKTRRKDFDNLALQLVSKKTHPTAAMKYGIKTESMARDVFMKHFQCRVFMPGLIIHTRQPWLCCSPDGIITTGSDMILLEIKCPFSCKNRLILNYESKTSEVKYLYFEGEEPKLKRSHTYYTQIQVSLYLTNANFCTLMVYSSAQHIFIKVLKDEEFLAEFLPKIENFYFECFLPLVYNYLCTTSDAM